MEKLFAVYLGGKADGARIEVHDLTFVVAPDVKAAFPKLRDNWFGDKKSVHVDAWMDLTLVDGHKVTLLDSTQNDSSKKLYAVNVGCYNKQIFGEEHHFFFLVAEDINKVKARAKALVVDRELTHIDNVIDVDDIIEVSQVDGKSISLAQAETPFQPEMNHVYWPIKV